MEGVYVAFPFALRQPTFWLESANAVYRPGIDQLPDTCCDWYSIQHGVGVTDGEDGVLWATREAPLVQLGGIHTGEWARNLHAERGHVYAWLMNNLYFTNFKAAQGGQTRFSFRLTTQPGAVGETDVRRFGDSFGVPPLARLAPVEVGAYQWLEIAPETVQAQALTTDRHNPNALILRLKETSGQPSSARILWRGAQPIAITRTDLLESAAGEAVQGDGRVFELAMKAHELVTLRLAPEAASYSSGSPA